MGCIALKSPHLLTNVICGLVAAASYRTLAVYHISVRKEKENVSRDAYMFFHLEQDLLLLRAIANVIYNFLFLFFELSDAQLHNCIAIIVVRMM